MRTVLNMYAQHTLKLTQTRADMVSTHLKVAAVSLVVMGLGIALSVLQVYQPITRPPPSSAPGEIVLPPSNTTLPNSTSNALCVERCGAGVCNITSVDITCSSCAPGFSGTLACVYTDHCLVVPFCFEPDAMRALAVHDALLRIHLEYARQLNMSEGQVPASFPHSEIERARNMTADWAIVRDTWNHTQIGSSEDARARSVIDMLNLFLIGKRTVLASDSTESPTRFLRDDAAAWSHSLPAYEPIEAFAPYLDALKSRVCTAQWTQGDGLCAPPLATEPCSGSTCPMTASELARWRRARGYLASDPTRNP
jgi:hypothetical protein